MFAYLLLFEVFFTDRPVLLPLLFALASEE